MSGANCRRRRRRSLSASHENGDRIFPYTTDAIGAAFTRACKLLGIDDLHFHDLRHEGVSRLFEAGLEHSARRAGVRASVMGDRCSDTRSIRQRDDKFAGWKWRP